MKRQAKHIFPELRQSRQGNRPYETPTVLKVFAIKNGRNIAVPEMKTLLVREDPRKRTEIILGRFASEWQAVLFAVTGIVRHGTISLDDILSSMNSSMKVRRAGFLHSCNEQDIVHWLKTKRLVVQMNLEPSYILLLRDDISETERGEIQLQTHVDIARLGSVLEIPQGRKFR